MPVPSSITDLSTTVGSNYPTGSETPQDGDNYIRALSAFIAQLRTGVATFTDITSTGNTVLGNATGDTLNAGNGGLVKDAFGRVYGNALHNNASGNSGSTQYIASGTYSPTITSVLNISSSSRIGSSTWIRVGSAVTVTGQVSIDPNAASTLSIVGITIPIASAFTGPSDCNGTAVSMTGAGVHLAGAIYAEDVGDIAWLVFNPGTDTASRPWTYTFTYLVR
jgi:hypothetical protein